jgi:hypothetical protein
MVKVVKTFDASVFARNSTVHTNQLVACLVHHSETNITILIPSNGSFPSIFAFNSI